jgi:hypothetical protein
VQSGIDTPKFRLNVLPPSSVSDYVTTRVAARQIARGTRINDAEKQVLLSPLAMPPRPTQTSTWDHISTYVDGSSKCMEWGAATRQQKAVLRLRD